MKKYILILFLLIVYIILSFTILPKGIASVLHVVRPSMFKASIPTLSDVQEDKHIQLVAAIPTATPLPPPPSMIPATLIIPKLNISAPIEQVGQTKTGAMDVPKNAADVAWYVYGAKPGEVGNAVINGHYDTPSGRGAVFYHLRDMAKGDEVQVISEDGVQTDFVVTEKAVVPSNNFPSEYVFFTKPGTNLNIITCDGIWDPVKHNYSTRVVVYAELKSAVQ